MAALKESAGIWVRLASWVLDDADLPDPVPGAALSNMGIRVYGALEGADDTAEEGLIAESEPSAADPRTPVYRVTGRVESSQVLELNTVPGIRGAQQELVLGVGALRLQAQVDGNADAVAVGARVVIRGTLYVIARYEWEDFGLVDTRTNWKIADTLNQADGDYLIRLPVPQPAR